MTAAAELGFSTPRDIAAENEECWRLHKVLEQAEQLAFLKLGGSSFHANLARANRFGRAVTKAARKPRNQQGEQKLHLTKMQSRELAAGVIPDIDLGTVSLTRRQKGQLKAVRRRQSARKVAATA